MSKIRLKSQIAQLIYSVLAESFQSLGNFPLQVAQSGNSSCMSHRLA